jgi:pimeloyl-ACP methyl ester carboxylesterase
MGMVPFLSMREPPPLAQRAYRSDGSSAAMKPSRSTFLDVRGLRYHCREWGEPGARLVLMTHGWMDVSASFQFLVDALQGDWHVVAPDWRGYGLSAWSGADSYWFPDYLADLEVLLRHYSPERPVDLLGHSMGGNIVCLYAGIRPDRVARLVNLEGFGLADAKPGDAPRRYRRWLDSLASRQRFRDYASFAELAGTMRARDPRLTPERALFFAEHWGQLDPDGRVRLLSDPAHKRVSPVAYRLEEAKACWRAIQAPVLWIDGEESPTLEDLRIHAEDYAARKSCFPTLVEHVIPAAGHMVHHDQPEAVAALVEAFLQR